MNKKFLSALLSVAMIAPMLATTPVMATQQQTTSIYDGYYLTWADEFNGDELNRNDWNVELHEPGWVNSELQEYVDSDENIKVENGNLVITPVKVEKTVETGNIISNADFSNGLTGWTPVLGGGAVATSEVSGGKITYNITNVGEEDWNVQLKQTGISLQAGKTYVASYDVKSSVARSIKSGIMSAAYDWYGGEDPSLPAGETKTISYEFEMSEDDTNATFYFSLGLVEGSTAGTIEISNICLKESPFDKIVQSVNDLGMYVDSAASASKTVEADVLTLTVDNFGTADYHVQPKMDDAITLNEGYEYKVSFDITSSIDKSFKASISKADYSWYNGVVDNLSAGVEKHVEFATDKITTTDSLAGFSINLGNDSETLDVSEENPAIITIKNLTVTGTKEEQAGDTVTTYTSGRISTQNKQTFTYGLYEVRAKVPQGAGFLPAFWLMANDESIYGQWPKCGEIDCMEVLGGQTNTVYGTIHYGNPSNQKQGSATSTDNPETEEVEDFSTDFHTYTCDWQPGKITWYVDGIKYYETDDWFTSNGNETATYPAPFDQPFYIILNLAVGGQWVGYPDENTFEGANDYIVDYVRVYQKADYDENVVKPESTVVEIIPEANHNYINSPNAYDNSNWVFKVDKGGAGNASTTEDPAICIDPTSDGDVDYSIQLLQAGVPLAKNNKYKVSFTAWAESERTMVVAVKAPDRNYQEYMNSKLVYLGTDKYKTNKTHFSYTFDMTEDSDPNARLEFNMGHSGSTDKIYISDVKLEWVEELEAEPEPDYNPVKADGNYLYNGSFSEGANHLGNWTISTEAVGAQYYVSDFADGRRLKLYAPKYAIVSVSQNKVNVEPGKTYLVSFDAETSDSCGIGVSFGNDDDLCAYNNIGITPGNNTYARVVNIPDDYTKEEVSTFCISIIGKCDVAVDNIRVSDFGLISDGDFSSGSLGSYEFWYQNGAADALAKVKNGAVEVTVDNTGTADWHIQLKQNNLKIEKGDKYVLSFKAKSTLERQFRAIIQGPESRGYTVYSSTEDNVDGIFTVYNSEDYENYEVEFVMTEETDPNAFLSMCFGKVGEAISTEHKITIDDISLEVYKPVTLHDGDNELTYYVKMGECLYSGISLPDTSEYNTEADGSGETITADTVVTGAFDIYTIHNEPNNYYDISLDADEYYYTGSQIKPVVTVKNGDTVLTLNKDYKVTYKNNIKVSDFGETNPELLPYLNITFIGNYLGTNDVRCVFNICEKSINDADITIADVPEKYNYSNKVIKPVPAVKRNGKPVPSSKLTYTYNQVESDGAIGDVVDPKEPGKYAVSISGKDGYAGAVVKEFTILNKEQKLMSSLKLTVGKKNVPYSGMAIANDQLATAFGITLKNGTKTLVAGEDYTVTTTDDTKNVGTITLTIKGNEAKGFFGSITTTVKITGKSLSKATISGIKSLPYNNGNAVTQNETIKYGTVLRGILAEEYEVLPDVSEESQAVKADYDYIISYANNYECGTASVTYTGVNNYIGSVTKTFKITGTNISRATVQGFVNSVVYTGKTEVMDLKIKVGADEAVRVIDKNKYDTLSADAKKNFKAVAEYINNNKAGKATLVITGVNGYEGKISRSFTIKAYDIAKDTESRVSVKLLKTNYEYDKSGVKPVPVVKFNGRVLTQNVDYTLAYANNTAVNDGTNARKLPTVKVVGKGNYAGTNITATFKIERAQIQYHAEATAENVKYANKINNYKPSSLKVVDENGKTLKAGTDYKIIEYREYTTFKTLKSGDKISAPESSEMSMGVLIEGIGNYTGNLHTYYTVYANDISMYVFNVKEPKAYTGKPVTISKDDITVTYKGSTIDFNSFDIDVDTYSKNINTGTATVYVKGNGNYGGKKKVTFKISGKILSAQTSD